MAAKLYLIPTPLGEYPPADILAAPTLALLPSISLFFVEEVRSARRFLSAAGLKGKIASLEFHEINEHTTPREIEEMASLLGSRDAALISEAGLPAVADPGSRLVALAHEMGVEVVPHSGPSSLMLALMASGLNGQSFTFNGYLPVKPDQRRSAIEGIERASARSGSSQIFIETPYRNDSLLESLLAVLHPETRLCIAADITLPTQFIATRSVASWRSRPQVIGKRPCVFIIQA